LEKSIELDAFIKGKMLQSPGTNFVGPASTYQTTFLALSKIWQKNVPGLGALSPELKHSKL
jgi:hypothetical protein